MKARQRAVLFDLDGTLVDTAPDLIGAINELLAAAGKPVADAAALRGQASNGSRGMIGATLGLKPGDPEYLAQQQEFLRLYQARISRESRCFPGVDALIAAMDAKPLSWGVVSNKPHHLTRLLIDELGLQPAVVLGGDASCRPKPAPDLLELACAHLRISPAQCLYVGDAPRDIAAGRAAGMTTLAAAYGYLEPDEDAAAWGADHVAQGVNEIWPILAGLTA